MMSLQHLLRVQCNECLHIKHTPRPNRLSVQWRLECLAALFAVGGFGAGEQDQPGRRGGSGRRPAAGPRRRGGPNASVGGSGLIALHRRLNAVEACDLLCLRQVDVPKRVYATIYTKKKNSSVLRVVLPLPLCGAYTLPR